MRLSAYRSRLLALVFSPFLGGCLYSMDAVHQLSRRDCVAGVVQLVRSEAPRPELAWHADCQAHLESLPTTRRGRFTVDLPAPDCPSIQLRRSYVPLHSSTRRHAKAFISSSTDDATETRCDVFVVSDEDGIRVHAADGRLLGETGLGLAPAEEWLSLPAAIAIDGVYAPFIIGGAPIWLTELAYERCKSRF